MTEHQTKIPKRRFKGFTGEWEVKKLGDVTQAFEYGMNAAATEFDGENKYIRITDIDENNNTYLNEDVVSPSENLEDKYLVKKNDILFARTGASTGKTYLYNEKDGKLYFAGFLIRANVNSHNNSKFVFLQTKTKEYNNWVQVMSMRSGQPGINSQEYASYSFYAPSKEEQQKIGEFFSELDDRIELQRSKIEKMKVLKKAYLSEMFPAEGETTPKRRFKGFTGEWEKRKLWEVTNSYSGGTPKVGKSEYYGGNIPFIRSAEINSDSTELFITELGLNNSSAKMIEIGYILYALYGATSGEVGISRIKGAINQAILAIIPKSGYDTQFITQWLRREKYKIIDKYLQGGQGNLSGSIVKNLEVMFPSLEEQQKIGEFFSEMEEMIELHEEKLKKLQNLKQAYLNELLI